MSNFVHLHVHTEYSLLDGVARIKKLVKTAKEMGMPAVAITDHGNMYGAITFYEEARKAGIKPIIGCEVYITEDRHVKQGRGSHAHLLLIAKNYKGYENLSKLNSHGFLEGMYYGKPRVDYELLKKHSEGLIVLSGCLGSDIPQAILNREYDRAEELISWFKEIWQDDFYLELQNHGMPEQVEVNAKLREYAKQFNIKLVATNDVHYIYKEDAELQEVLMCIQTGKTMDDPSRMQFPSQEFYLKSYDEMLKVFPNEPEALANTVEIANKCDLKFELGVYKFPKYPDLPEGMDPETYLRQLVMDGLKVRYGEVKQEHIDRFETELSVIKKQGFIEYFIIVWDFIAEARRRDIPVGPGRGSGAGSIIAYALKITNIDPLKYDLLFERFLHGERVTAPDFDIDFSDEGRDEIIEYVRQKYGEERVARIVTFGSMAAKGAIKDVARVMKMPYSQADKLSKAISNKIKGPMVLKKAFGLDDTPEGMAYAVPELVEAYNNSLEVKKVVDLAVKIEGMPRQTGIHACGVVIGADNLDKFIPLAKNGDEVTTQFPYAQVEKLGHLKMDFLGLRNLNDIKKAVELVYKNHGVKIDFDNMGVDDPQVYKLISTGNTKAIFQIESSGFQKFMRELKPTSIEDIIAGVSLYRPGPMDTIPRYVHNKHNPQDITYHHPLLEPILKVTYGSIVYQEQVMRIVQDLAGYTLGQADMVRRMMGKKLADEMAAEKNTFIYGRVGKDGNVEIEGAVKRGVPADVAEKIWAEMETFAEYAFNKSHAAVYSYITYQTAYLKCYYKPEFLTAVLNNRIAKSEEVANYVNYAREEKIEVLPPDINESDTYFSVKDGKIRFGLAALKGVGVGVIDQIIEERNKNGKFTSIDNFISRFDGSVLNKRSLESLILSGAFDSFNVYRSHLMFVYQNLIDRETADRKKREQGQLTLFDDLLKDDVVNEVNYPSIPEYDEAEMLKLEKEVSGVYISGHPLAKYKDKFENYTLTGDMLHEMESDGVEVLSEDEEMHSGFAVEDGQEVVAGGMLTEVKKLFTKRDSREMAFATLEDLYGKIELMIFPQIYDKYKQDLVDDNLVTVYGKISIREGERPIVLVNKIELWANEGNKDSAVVVNEKPKKLYLKYDLSNNKPLDAEILNVLNAYPGDSDVVVYCTTLEKPFKLQNKVNLSSFILNELHAYLTHDCIVVK